MLEWGGVERAPYIWALLRTTIPKRLWSAAPICPQCGYALIGLPESGICPECGTGYTPESAHLSASRSRAQLRRVCIWYGVWGVGFPVLFASLLRPFDPIAQNRVMMTAVSGVIIAPILSARLVGALTALAVERADSRSRVLGLLLFSAVLAAHIVLMVATFVAMPAVAYVSQRFL